MNVVDSQLSKTPFPTFTQFIDALNNHVLRANSYEESKSIDHNLALIGMKGRGQSRGRDRGGEPRSTNFTSQGRGLLPSANIKEMVTIFKVKQIKTNYARLDIKVSRIHV